MSVYMLILISIYDQCTRFQANEQTSANCTRGFNRFYTLTFEHQLTIETLLDILHRVSKLVHPVVKLVLKKF